jgi:uncharacterized protein (TIGR03067 family)
MKTGLLVLALVFGTAGQAVQDDVKKELDRLQGNWQVTSFNGEAVPAEAQFFLTFKADKYEQWNNGAVDERGTVKLNVASKPKSIDLIITEGNDAGKTQLGVYEVEGDTASVTLAIPGETGRPAALTQGALHVVLTKVK